MSAFNVGNTIKITNTNRHPAAHELLTEHVDLDGASIVDIGASDGSTSVDLIRAIPQFKSFVISDLYLTVTYRTAWGHVLFYDPQGTCILVCGSWWLGWPAGSRLVRALYWPVIRRARRSTPSEALLLNPDARAVVANDSRVSYAVHDVFQPWPGSHPDVIKVANLLRRLYFTDEEITQALRAIHASLDDGGHLLMVDNPRADVRPRAGLYRREGSGFTPVATVEGTPEIEDLILDLTVENER